MKIWLPILVLASGPFLSVYPSKPPQKGTRCSSAVTSGPGLNISGRAAHLYPKRSWWGQLVRSCSGFSCQIWGLLISWSEVTLSGTYLWSLDSSTKKTHILVILIGDVIVECFFPSITATMTLFSDNGINGPKHVSMSLTLVTANLVVPGIILIQSAGMSYNRSWSWSSFGLESWRPHRSHQMCPRPLDDTPHCLRIRLIHMAMLLCISSFSPKTWSRAWLTVSLLMFACCKQMCTLQVTSSMLNWLHMSGHACLLGR